MFVIRGKNGYLVLFFCQKLATLSFFLVQNCLKMYCFFKVLTLYMKAHTKCAENFDMGNFLDREGQVFMGRQGSDGGGESPRHANNSWPTGH